MVTKKQVRQVKAAHKHVKLKPHHSRPYRKRHVGLLFISLIALAILGIFLVGYRGQVLKGFSDSKSFVGGLFNQNASYDVKVNSAYGFNFSYDQKQFYASGIDTATGDLKIGAELSQQRAYSVVRLAPNIANTAHSVRSASNSALTMTYHPGAQHANEALDGLALKDGGLDSTKLTRLSTVTSVIGGIRFQKNTWQSRNENTLAPSLTAKFVTYSGLVRGDAVTIVISLGVGDGNDAAYQNVLDSMLFSNEVSYVAAPTASVVAKITASRSLLDTVTNTNVAAAATNGVDLSGSEKVAALYSPAVVKIYNAYCMDIRIDGKSYLKDVCSAVSGSGFFVSQDGYLGTNGHVASVTPLDLVISDAITYYSTKGDPQYFNYLVSLTNLKQSDIPAGATDTQKVGIIINALYTIDSKRVTANNDVQNLLVQVTAKNPNVASLLQDTQDRKKYTDSSVLNATVAAADYRANDGYDGFKASDVAIIKVEGANFPIVQLGSIDSVTQGSDLSILGYPGNAADNGIVDSTSSEATLTTGKVSAKKNAENSSKKLIETDTTIGHGNSGGPALDNDGGVVGIATYTADGSARGDGTYNYIRDIKDLKDLALANNISFDTNSATQSEWQKGIANFYSSHYSKALSSFKTVQTLYPNDSRVAEFTAAAQKHIDAGDDVVYFPVFPVAVAAVVVLLGIATALLLIVRHAKKHVIYAKGVAQGSVLPAGKGVGMQRVFVSADGTTVDTPLTLSTAPMGTNVQTTVTIPAQATVASSSPVIVQEGAVQTAPERKYPADPVPVDDET